MNSIRIHTEKPYDVHIGKDILKLTGKRITAIPGQNYHKIAVVTDSTVAELYLDGVADSLKAVGYPICTFVFPNGEASKSMQTSSDMVRFLCENEMTRSDLVVALGGGVVGDLAGFVSSVYLRGVDFVQIPTTLLAAVDSSVGGKTAINIPQGKNLVGTFWQPRMVLCDINAMSTLSEADYGDGLAEIIKYGCIWDEGLFRLVESGGVRSSLEQVIARCVEIKAQVVREDEHDHGLRQILNFGHTAGHGVEKLSGFATSHGRGVAIGMCIASAAGETLGQTPSGTTARIRKALRLHRLPTRSPYPADTLAQACLGDKKRSGNTLNLVLLQHIGKALIHPVDTSQLAELFAAPQEI